MCQGAFFPDKITQNPRSVHKKQVQWGWGCAGSSSDLHLNLQFMALVPTDHCEHLGWLWERSKLQVVKATSQVAIFGDVCDQLLQRRHFKSLFGEIVITYINVH